MLWAVDFQSWAINTLLVFIYARRYDLVLAALWWARRCNALSVAWDNAVDAAIALHGLEAVSYERVNRVTGEIETHIDNGAIRGLDCTEDERDDGSFANREIPLVLATRSLNCETKLAPFGDYIANHLSPAHRNASVYRAASAKFWA